MFIAVKLAAPRPNVVLGTVQLLFEAGKPTNLIRKEARRYLNQSSKQNQKAINQNLVSIARNISFRQCRNHQTFKQSPAAYSITLDSSYVLGPEAFQKSFESQDEVESQPLELEQKPIRKYYGQFFNQATTVSTTQRPLVVLMSWLEAQEKHIEKYRQFWLERGYDVLNVKTSPLDLLLPSVGAKKISADFVKFLLDKQYKEIVLHGFSVGGYQFGEFLIELDKHDPQVREQLKSSIKGIVFDSLVPFEGIQTGVANSVTRNPFLVKILEPLLGLYLIVCRGFATKHYLRASEKVWAGPLRCPTLFIVSKDDKVSDIRIIERLSRVWSAIGINCHMQVFDSSPHVQHFTKHTDQYVDRVDKFLEMINVMKDNKRGTPPDGA